MTLDDLGRRYDTDKSSRINAYLQYYERHFAPRRERVRRVLELGVWQGASLLVWRDYFPSAKIVGFDRDLSKVRSEVRTREGITLKRGECGESRDLARLAKLGPFDIVIDDASHLPTHQIAAFETLWPHVKSGGLYIIEDTCTSYWSDYTLGIDSLLPWLALRIDSVHLLGARRHGAARRFDLVAKANALTEEARTLEAMHVYNGTVVFERRDV